MRWERRSREGRLLEQADSSKRQGGMLVLDGAIRKAHEAAGKRSGWGTNPCCLNCARGRRCRCVGGGVMAKRAPVLFVSQMACGGYTPKQCGQTSALRKLDAIALAAAIEPFGVPMVIPQPRSLVAIETRPRRRKKRRAKAKQSRGASDLAEDFGPDPERMTPSSTPSSGPSQERRRSTLAHFDARGVEEAGVEGPFPTTRWAPLPGNDGPAAGAEEGDVDLAPGRTDTATTPSSDSACASSSLGLPAPLTALRVPPQPTGPTALPRVLRPTARGAWSTPGSTGHSPRSSSLGGLPPLVPAGLPASRPAPHPTLDGPRAAARPPPLSVDVRTSTSDLPTFGNAVLPLEGPSDENTSQSEEGAVAGPPAMLRRRSSEASDGGGQRRYRASEGGAVVGRGSQREAATVQEARTHRSVHESTTTSRRGSQREAATVQEAGTHRSVHEGAVASIRGSQREAATVQEARTHRSVHEGAGPVGNEAFSDSGRGSRRSSASEALHAGPRERGRSRVRGQSSRRSASEGGSGREHSEGRRSPQLPVGAFPALARGGAGDDGARSRDMETSLRRPLPSPPPWPRGSSAEHPHAGPSRPHASSSVRSILRTSLEDRGPRGASPSGRSVGFAELPEGDLEGDAEEYEGGRPPQGLGRGDSSGDSSGDGSGGGGGGGDTSGDSSGGAGSSGDGGFRGGRRGGGNGAALGRRGFPDPFGDAGRSQSLQSGEGAVGAGVYPLGLVRSDLTSGMLPGGTEEGFERDGTQSPWSGRRGEGPGAGAGGAHGAAMGPPPRLHWSVASEAARWGSVSEASALDAAASVATESSSGLSATGTGLTRAHRRAQRIADFEGAVREAAEEAARAVRGAWTALAGQARVGGAQGRGEDPRGSAWGDGAWGGAALSGAGGQGRWGGAMGRVTAQAAGGGWGAPSGVGAVRVAPGVERPMEEDIRYSQMGHPQPPAWAAPHGQWEGNDAQRADPRARGVPVRAAQWRYPVPASVPVERGAGAEAAWAAGPWVGQGRDGGEVGMEHPQPWSRGDSEPGWDPGMGWVAQGPAWGARAPQGGWPGAGVTGGRSPEMPRDMQRGWEGEPRGAMSGLESRGGPGGWQQGWTGPEEARVGQRGPGVGDASLEGWAHGAYGAVGREGIVYIDGGNAGDVGDAVGRAAAHEAWGAWGHEGAEQPGAPANAAWQRFSSSHGSMLPAADVHDADSGLGRARVGTGAVPGMGPMPASMQPSSAGGGREGGNTTPRGGPAGLPPRGQATGAGLRAKISAPVAQPRAGLGSSGAIMARRPWHTDSGAWGGAVTRDAWGGFHGVTGEAGEGGWAERSDAGGAAVQAPAASGASHGSGSAAGVSRPPSRDVASVRPSSAGGPSVGGPEAGRVSTAASDRMGEALPGGATSEGETGVPDMQGGELSGRVQMVEAGSDWEGVRALEELTARQQGELDRVLGRLGGLEARLEEALRSGGEAAAELTSELQRERRRAAILREIVAEQQRLLLDTSPVFLAAKFAGDGGRGRSSDRVPPGDGGLQRGPAHVGQTGVDRRAGVSGAGGGSEGSQPQPRPQPLEPRTVRDGQQAQAPGAAGQAAREHAGSHDALAHERARLDHPMRVRLSLLGIPLDGDGAPGPTAPVSGGQRGASAGEDSGAVAALGRHVAGMQSELERVMEALARAEQELQESRKDAARLERVVEGSATAERLREEEVVRARRELERLRDLVASRGARGRSGGGQGRDGAGRGESRRPGDAGRTGWAPEAPVDVIRARRDEDEDDELERHAARLERQISSLLAQAVHLSGPVLWDDHDTKPLSGSAELKALIAGLLRSHDSALGRTGHADADDDPGVGTNAAPGAGRGASMRPALGAGPSNSAHGTIWENVLESVRLDPAMVPSDSAGTSMDEESGPGTDGRRGHGDYDGVEGDYEGADERSGAGRATSERLAGRGSGAGSAAVAAAGPGSGAWRSTAHSGTPSPPPSSSGARSSGGRGVPAASAPRFSSDVAGWDAASGSGSARDRSLPGSTRGALGATWGAVQAPVRPSAGSARLSTAGAGSDADDEGVGWMDGDGEGGAELDVSYE